MGHPDITIIGGGLAGCEAAWQAGRRGLNVRLFEMRPVNMTPVHKTDTLAELVCSNSLGTKDPFKASGVLKEELELLDSLIMKAARETSVPAGQALAVDRILFSQYIEKAILDHKNIEVIREEVNDISGVGITVIASGPMTSPALAQKIQDLIGNEYLYFFDAVSPIVSLESLDLNKIFKASRYGKGESEYLNCPMNESEYCIFVNELNNAQRVDIKEYEEIFFESCLPVEEIAKRGIDTLRFGPMKPVGLMDPQTGQQPYAVVQLRQENRHGTLFNMVGFQTRLKMKEQKRIFSMIPGLENAEFLRLGVMHRNIYINAPKCINSRSQLISDKKVLIAGQVSGVEGYLESTASGAICGINASLMTKGFEPSIFPDNTAIGSLLSHITKSSENDFQPMNINFGLFPPLKERINKRSERNKIIRERSLNDLKEYIITLNERIPITT